MKDENHERKSFSENEIRNSVELLHFYKEQDKGISDINNAILTALEALDRQYPMSAYVRYKKQDTSALIECPVCEKKVVINYELYKEHYEEWHCKKCGQKLRNDFKE